MPSPTSPYPVDSALASLTVQQLRCATEGICPMGHGAMEYTTPYRISCPICGYTFEALRNQGQIEQSAAATDLLNLNLHN